ncbi:MAG TPA: hypothetical protein VJ021_02370 [Thermoplasmata archaeon]|nr:hypothetical protein [Thermoplasmata archaeon]
MAPAHDVNALLMRANRSNPGVIELLRLYERMAKSVDLEFAFEEASRPLIEYHTADSTVC